MHDTMHGVAVPEWSGIVVLVLLSTCRSTAVQIDEKCRVRFRSPDAALDMSIFTDGLQYLKFSPKVAFCNSKYFCARGNF